MIQSRLRVRLDRLSIQQGSLRRFLLAHGIEQPVITRRCFKNDVSMNVVKHEVRGEHFGLSRVDCPAASTKIEDQVVEAKRGPKQAERIPVKAAGVQRILPRRVRKR